MQKKVGNVSQLEEDEKDDFEGLIYKVAEKRNGEPVMVSLMIADIPVDMELGTGATVSLLPCSVYDRHFTHFMLWKSHKKLRSFCSTMLDVTGEIGVPVKYQRQKAELSLVVTEATDDIPLLGQNRLLTICLDWAA